MAGALAAHDLADANYVASFREHARWQDPCEVIESDGAATA